MNQARSFRKSIALVILLLIAISAGAFFAKVVAYKYSIHHDISGVSHAAPLEERPGFFYPAPKQGPSELFQKRDVKYPFTFIVYGDSRETAGYEKDALITQIIIEKPSFVIHVGDIVLYGGEHQWKIFDLFVGKIMDSGIPIYPVLGNHEYYDRKGLYSRNPEEQLQLYFNRFKFLENRRWYSFIYGNSLFLILDTNTDYSPGGYQYKWLIDKLKGESPGFLFIAFHHPPYTKDLFKLDRKSERLLADLFENYRGKELIKTDIVFSGHVHNYERYRHNGINYVVSGGGGAPQHSVKRDPGDFYTKTGETYHYCKITVSKTKAIFEMIYLDKKDNSWVIGDTFTISK